jgi:hypothetical protein
VTLRVLDLFSGLEGWSTPFRARGHDVWSVDIDPQFEPDLLADITTTSWIKKLPKGWRPDIVLASPPCELFSTAGWHQHAWSGPPHYQPLTSEAHNARRTVRAGLWVIKRMQPTSWIVENPRALLRKLDVVPGEPRTVWYCHYGLDRAKPTDLWGTHTLPTLELRPPCHNQRAGHTAFCCCHDHVPAPRGSVSGTQGTDTALAGVIPYDLALDVCLAAERKSDGD